MKLISTFWDRFVPFTLNTIESVPGFVTVFELLGCELVKPGEFLSGNLDELGNQQIYNETRNEKLRVFVHERDCEEQKAIEKYFAPVMPSPSPANRFDREEVIRRDQLLENPRHTYV